jgi:polyisoprenoid-binding protein YceI
MKTDYAASRVLCGILLLAFCAGAPAQTRPAQAEPAQAAAPQKVTVHLNPANSEIRWTLSDPLHTVHGTFALKGGLITFDPQTGVAQGEVLVDVASGESGSHARDLRMQKDVLESAKFPQAIFHPEKVAGSIRSGTLQNVTVTGTFTIHGGDHPLQLAMGIQITGKDVVATTHFVVPYVAWGMKDPSNFMLHVQKQVDVDVVAKGSVEGLP